MVVKEQSFEASMRRLEEIVGQLEQGKLNLDQALQMFEEGTALAKNCAQMLDQAEQKVQQLLGSEGQQEVPFQEGAQTDGV